MKRVRLIARLDIKGENLIKGVHLEGLRVIGSPSKYAQKYYNQGADELIFMDTVASLYGRNHLSEIIKLVAKDIFTGGSWKTIALAGYGKGGRGLTALDITNPDNPIHMFSILNNIFFV